MISFYSRAPAKGRTAPLTFIRRNLMRGSAFLESQRITKVFLVHNSLKPLKFRHILTGFELLAIGTPVCKLENAQSYIKNYYGELLENPKRKINSARFPACPV
jgi:hypothetical protein